MYFDRFDILEAWYLYLNTHYFGQGDPLYARLCKLRSYFNPRDGLRDVENLTENGQEIYFALTVNHSGLVPSYYQKINKPQE